MKSFKEWGLKRRILKDHNYNALWIGSSLKTVRFGEGHAADLPYFNKEFYDIAVNNKCNKNAMCPFCYTNASSTGEDYMSPGLTWKKYVEAKYWEKVYDLMNLPEDDVLDEIIKKDLRSKLVEANPKNNFKVTYTNKPFQIAIGSTGEPTIHPEFCSFLKAVYDTNVVPNYTTNGIILSYAHDVYDNTWKTKNLTDDEIRTNIYKAHELLDYTKKYVGGVAVSYGNKLIRPFAEHAIVSLLLYGNTNINIHHLIGTNEDVDEMIKLAKEYGDDIKYHVLLPLMAHGRSKEGMKPETFDYLEDQILKNNIKNVAFGANFSPFLENAKIKTYNYPPESLSANMILKTDNVIITPSSFNLSPVDEIKF